MGSRRALPSPPVAPTTRLRVIVIVAIAFALVGLWAFWPLVDDTRDYGQFRRELEAHGAAIVPWSLLIWKGGGLPSEDKSIELGLHQEEVLHRLRAAAPCPDISPLEVMPDGHVVAIVAFNSAHPLTLVFYHERFTGVGYLQRGTRQDYRLAIGRITGSACTAPERDLLSSAVRWSDSGGQSRIVVGCAAKGRALTCWPVALVSDPRAESLVTQRLHTQMNETNWSENRHPGPHQSN